MLGPNGAGKTTFINMVSNVDVNNFKITFWVPFVLLSDVLYTKLIRFLFI